MDAVYLDFSKAFDKVETGVLLHKLRYGKVLGKVGCWLAAFLDSAHRHQAVVVEGRISALSPMGQCWAYTRPHSHCRYS